MSKILELIGMLVIGLSFVKNFPKTIDWFYFLIGIAFFLLGMLVEKFVLK